MRQDIKANDCHDIITSEDYVDLLLKIDVLNIQELADVYGAECYQQLTNNYGVFYVPKNNKVCEDFYLRVPYLQVPNVYGLSGIRSLRSSGIYPVINNPRTPQTGKGVLIGIIDTGIDYLHPVFRYEDNTTKIQSIWDQTTKGTLPEGFGFGAEYTKEQINEALASDDPYSIVAEKDEIGHGTFIAGVAAGRKDPTNNFMGAAPDAELLIVKLKQAKQCVREVFFIKEDTIAYMSTDILLGARYLLDKAQKLGKPIVILFAGESNEGPHTGTTLIERTFAEYGKINGVVFCLSAGNEANKRHHFLGQFTPNQNIINVQMNVADENGLFINLWNREPDKYSVGFLSPAGSETGKIPFKTNEIQTYTLDQGRSVINVEYVLVEERAGQELIIIRMQTPLSGIWTIQVHGDTVLNGDFDIYLPIDPFVNPPTAFLQPNPYTTVVNPATNSATITIGSYNDVTNSIDIASGRGYTRSNQVKPDIVAPGVNVVGPIPGGDNNQFGVMSGSSVSAGITAGASALLLQWGILEGNKPDMDTVTVKTYLILGANRQANMTFPNREWGYGKLDLENTITSAIT